jgi:hypothetical protein
VSDDGDRKGRFVPPDLASELVHEDDGFIARDEPRKKRQRAQFVDDAIDVVAVACQPRGCVKPARHAVAPAYHRIVLAFFALGLSLRVRHEEGTAIARLR